MAACRRQVVFASAQGATALRAEGCGGGFAASKKERGWRRGLCRRVVRSAQGRQPYRAEGGGGGSAAGLLKSALWDWLFVSYGMIGILQRKTIQPGLGPVGNAPLLPAASPPAGEICSTLTLVLTEAAAP